MGYIQGFPQIFGEDLPFGVSGFAYLRDSTDLI